MRLKIILPNVIIVLLVGLLSYAIVRQRLMNVEDTTPARIAVERAALGSAGVLQLQLLRAERWLSEHGSPEQLRERLVNLALADKGRRESTTGALTDLKRQAAETKGVFADAPDLAALVDKLGRAVARSEDPQTYDGEDFGAEYPALVAAIKENRTGSDVWLSSRYAHKHLVSWAPVRDRDGSALGAVVFAWNLSDQRIAGLSDATTALVVMEGGSLKVKAKANEAKVPGLASELERSLKDSTTRAFAEFLTSTTWNGSAVGIAALRNLGSGDKAAVAVARPLSAVENPDAVLWPIAAAAGLGVVFVLLAGVVLGNYFIEPVEQMEESLLQVINGNTNQRVQLEHAELGGLAFRINQLLNTVLGVEEDNTDEEGHPSTPPVAQHFSEAMSVEASSSNTSAEAASALASEPDDVYYARIYREYIDAKKANGESVETITEDVFVQRLRGMEQDQAAKGRRVRYVVQRGDGKVSFLAIPLG